MMAFPGVQVFLLGGFRVLVHGQQLAEEAWRRNKARQLFKLLLSRPGRRSGKDELIELLWPESRPETGSTNLRSALHALRRALNTPEAQSDVSPVVANRHSVWLRDDSGLWVDADEFERTLEQARFAADAVPLLQRANELYTGDYLADDLYEDWAAERREQLKRAWTGLQLRLAEEWERRGDVEAASSTLRRLLQLDPCDEGTARELMRLLATNGRRSEAVRVYQSLVRALHDELDVEPSEPTTVLFETAIPHAWAPTSFGGPHRVHNLPSQPGTFVGRDHEIAAAKAQILRADIRLLTLVGPAGCGKTRLAVHVAADLVPQFAGGVWFVDLSGERDADGVLFAIGRTLEVAQPLDGQSYLQRLAQTIATTHMLIILDNFEQVVAGGRQVSELMTGCPNLKVLVTSRELLHVRWEHEFQVPPLAPPSTSTRAPVEAIGSSPAVTLFVQRAQAIRPDWRLTVANASAVSQLCIRLDCLPLAIELAAARTRLFTPEAMLSRMDRRFELLNAAYGDVPERHRALELAIDWSHQLLSEPERATFRRAAVFTGGWTLDAAVAACADPFDRELDVLRILEALSNKSLLRVEIQADGEPRFSMLETIREFALSELVKSEELPTRQLAHARWCGQLAEAAEVELSGPKQMQWLDRLEREHDNLRAALRWSIDGGDPPLGVRLAAALGRFWEIRGYLQEAHRWLECAVRINDRVAPATRGKVRGAAGHIAFLRSEYQQARQLLEESLALARETADQASIVQALINLALVEMTDADDGRAYALLVESEELAKRLPDHGGLAASLSLLGQLAYLRGQLEEARSLLERSLELRRLERNEWATAQTLCDLGRVLNAQGFGSAATALHAEGLATWRELADVWGVAYALEGFALLFSTRDAVRAVRLLAVASAARERVGIRPLPARDANLEETRRACERVLGPDACAAAWSAGRGIDLEVAIEDVLEAVKGFR